ncbi:MAG: putative capsid protein [Cressdnaviricota sp.]|nr:MAG: putative capsid protein [Cressdnaviricota sp.]
MALGKRKYSSMSRGSRGGRMSSKYKTSGFRKYGKKLRSLGGYKASAIGARVARIERTIETKEGSRIFSGTNLAIQHNNILLLTSSLLFTTNGTNDPMGSAEGQRVGDRITLKGVAVSLFLQNQAQRPKVFYRVMVIKCAKGDTPTRATLFKGIVGNKMIDQMNTERYTIVQQKVFTITAQGAMAWTSANVPAGYPLTINGADAIGGVGTKICKMWIPGSKLARNGVVQYENASGQPKFFDYHLAILAYDWFGTPQDANNVGAVSDGWVKMYYKDA